MLKNPFDHLPVPLPNQEGGGNYIWGTLPYPCQRGFAPLDTPFPQPARRALLVVRLTFGYSIARNDGGGNGMSVFLYLGEDDFSRGEALARLRVEVGPPEMAVGNVSNLEGARLTLEELVQVCSAMPFLARQRLVVVSGLLARFEPREGRRGSSRGRRAREGELGPWAGLRPYVEQRVPATTTLVLVGGVVGPANALLQDLQGVAEVCRFDPLPPERVPAWIREWLGSRSQTIAPQAVALLAKRVGSDLWALSQEMEKLSLFTQGHRSIGVEDVRLMVPGEQGATVFQFVDGVVERRFPVAMAALQTLLRDGADAGYLLVMLGRQVRLLLEAQEALAEGLAPEEVGRRVGVRLGFPLQNLLQQARQRSGEEVRALHEALLETDLAIKQGVLEEAAALELLVGRALQPRYGR
ncbi:MAG: DNA polymerase III subunit delta [Dehalococcoidia bacterium]|nr:DNA polymerase III subunit delta [Dehalococcoidia bacterium]